MSTPEFEQSQLEIGRKLFAGACSFIMGAVSTDALPPPGINEIAFAGRSNVGKSSLLNALTNRKDLARASNTPGRTRELNFFNLQDTMRLVDLPGYGYARASRSSVDAWTDLTMDFLRGRADLRRVCILIDSRHGLKPTDLEVMKFLDTAAVNYQIVLTKADKIKPTQAEALRTAIGQEIIRRPAAHPLVHLTSSAKNTGLAALRADLAQFASA